MEDVSDRIVVESVLLFDIEHSHIVNLVIINKIEPLASGGVPLTFEDSGSLDRYICVDLINVLLQELMLVIVTFISVETGLGLGKVKL